MFLFCSLPDIGDPGNVLCEQSAPDWLHDHDPKPFLCREFQPFCSCLVVLVHEIILDLGKRPVIRFHDLFKEHCIVMEGEPGIAYPPVSDCVGQEVRDTECREALPERPVQPVHKVKIDHVCPEPVSYTHLTLPTNREV